MKLTILSKSEQKKKKKAKLEKFKKDFRWIGTDFGRAYKAIFFGIPRNEDQTENNTSVNTNKSRIA